MACGRDELHNLLSEQSLSPEDDAMTIQPFKIGNALGMKPRVSSSIRSSTCLCESACARSALS